MKFMTLSSRGLPRMGLVVPDVPAREEVRLRKPIQLLGPVETC